MKTTWDFVERFYPNYDNSNEIAYANDLNLLKEEGKLRAEDEALHNKVHLAVYEKTIENFILARKTQKVEKQIFVGNAWITVNYLTYSSSKYPKRTIIIKEEL